MIYPASNDDLYVLIDWKAGKVHPQIGEMQVAGEFLKSSSTWASIKLRGHRGLRSGQDLVQHRRKVDQRPKSPISTPLSLQVIVASPTHPKKPTLHNDEITLLSHKGKGSIFLSAFSHFCCVQSEREFSLQMERRIRSVAVSLQMPCSPSETLHLQPFKTCHFPLHTILREDEETSGSYWWLQGVLERWRTWRIIQECQLS